MSETQSGTQADADAERNIEPDEVLDVKGESCPMPVVKTRQKIDDVESGGVLEVVSTDSGSMSDIKGWASSTDGVELVSQIEDEDEGVYRHLVQKTDD